MIQMKTSAIFLAFLLIGSTTAFAASIDLSYYIQNGFDSHGKLKPEYQANIDKWNAIVDSTIPSWVPRTLNFKFELVVDDHGTISIFEIKIRDSSLDSIKKVRQTNDLTIITTNVETLNTIINSPTPIGSLKTSIQQHDIVIQTTSIRFNILLWLFLI